MIWVNVRVSSRRPSNYQRKEPSLIFFEPSFPSPGQLCTPELRCRLWIKEGNTWLDLDLKRLEGENTTHQITNWSTSRVWERESLRSWTNDTDTSVDGDGSTVQKNERQGNWVPLTLLYRRRRILREGHREYLHIEKPLVFEIYVPRVPILLSFVFKGLTGDPHYHSY